MSVTSALPPLTPDPQPSAPHPQAVRLAGYLDNLHASGYGHIDPSAQVALAAGGINAAQHKGVLDSIVGGLAGAWNSVGHWISDPAVQKPPTTAQTVSDHLNSTGIPTIPSSQIQSQQQHLQSKGYGTNLPAHGLWNADWQSALRQQGIDASSKPGFGQFSARDVFGPLFGMLYTHAIPLVKSMAVSSVQGLGHVAGIVAQPIVDTLTGAEFKGNTGTPSLGDNVGAWIQSATQLQNGAKTITPEQYMNTPIGLHDAVETLGAALTLSGMKTLAETGKVAFSGAMAAGKAVGGTGAKALITDLGTQAAYKPGNFWMNSILPQVGTQGFRRFAFTKALQGSPATNYMAGLNLVATGIADAIHIARPWVASAYRLPITGALGTIGEAVAKAGFKTTLIGDAEKLAGDPNAPMANQLTHLQPIAGSLGNALNIFQIGVHGPLQELGSAAPKLSQNFGKGVGVTLDATIGALHQNDLLSHFDNVMRTTGFDSSSSLLKRAISEGIPAASFYKALSDGVDKQAAYHFGEGKWQDAVNKSLVDSTNQDMRLDFIRNISHVVRNDDAQMAQARESYLTQSGLYRKDLLQSVVNMKADKTYSYSKDFMDKLRGDEIMRNEIAPYAQHLISADTMGAATKGGLKTINDAQTAALNGKMMDTTTLGYKNLQRPFVGTAQAEAFSLYKELQIAKPDFTAPKTLGDLKGNQDFSMPGEPADTFKMPEQSPFKPTTEPIDKSFIESQASPAELAVRSKAINYLANELNVDVSKLPYVSTEKLIDKIVDSSHKLASRIHVPFDAPAHLKESVAKLEALDYGLAKGTDIGYLFSHSNLPLNEMGKSQNTIETAASKLGMNFLKVSPEISSQESYAAMQNTTQDFLNKAQAEGIGEYPVWATAGRMNGWLRDNIRPSIDRISSSLFGAAASPASRLIRPIKGAMWKKEIEELMGKVDPNSTNGLPYDEVGAKAAIQREITSGNGPQFWQAKDVIKALTKAGDENGQVVNNYGDKVPALGLSKEAASDYYYAMQKGLRSAPAYSSGLSPFTKMLDSTFGLGNIPIMGFSGRRILDVGGVLKKDMLAVRYAGSYRFAFLRVVKSALKGVKSDIPFTMDAAGELKRMGTYDDAMKLRDDYLGKDPERDSVTDYVTKEYESRDIYNVYNPKAIEARNLWYLHQAELDKVGGDASLVDKGAVLKNLDNVFSYGSRTAAEKSVNAFFFPFSFEKTIARQLGGHLLDDPAARLMTAAAINAYDSADGKQVKAWMEENLPLFKEVEKFNPFYHGVGLGQFGGIFRLPYEMAKGVAISTLSPEIQKNMFVQMLSPKVITTKDSAKAALALVPALKDLNNIIVGVDAGGKKPWNPGGELRTSLNTLTWEAQNALNKVNGNDLANPVGNWDPQTHLSYDVQVKNGSSLRSQLATQLAKVLAANTQGHVYVWPDSYPKGIAGTKISMQGIDDLVQHVYPSYDPSKISQFAKQRIGAVSQERQHLATVAPQFLDTYDAWIKVSDLVQKRIRSLATESDPTKKAELSQKLASASDILRTHAQELAANDPTFAGFYKKYYESKYSPLGRL
jgi:hypothetical protein